jgi:hypothetical protein
MENPSSGRAALRRGHLRAPADARQRVPTRFMVPMRDSKIVEASHEPPPWSGDGSSPFFPTRVLSFPHEFPSLCPLSHTPCAEEGTDCGRLPQPELEARSSRKILILGAGNLLRSDDGFGMHLFHFLNEHYVFPPEVERLDAGTLGILVAHELEQADRVYFVDALDASGEPGTIRCSRKEEFLGDHFPVTAQTVA